MKVFDALNVRDHTVLAGSNRQLDRLSATDIASLVGQRVRVGFPDGTQTLEVDRVDVSESLTGQKNIFIAVRVNLPKMRHIQLQANSV